MTPQLARAGSIKLDDLVFAGVGPRQANGCHGAFGARTGEADQVHRWHQALHRLADLVVELMRETEVESLGADLFHHGLDDVFGGVAEYQWTVAETVVYLFVAVHIPNPGTGSDTGTKGSLKNNFTFYALMHPVWLRCESSEHPDIPAFSRLASQAPQRLKL